MNKATKLLSILITSAFVSQVNAAVTVIDFDKPSIEHGTIVDNEYASQGVTISSLNYNSPNSGGNAWDQNKNDNIVDMQVAFDTTSTGNSDLDLQYTAPGYANGYTALEIDGKTYGNQNNPGNVLILQNAQQLEGCDSGIKCTTPNDEAGTNAAGYFEFHFDSLVDIISLDTFDVEDNGEFIIQFFANGSLVESRVESTKNVGDNVPLANPIPDYTVQAGENTLLTMGDGEFVRQMLNVVGIDMMRVQLPGSGAIDNLAFRTKDVPAPATLSLLALSLLFVARRAKK
ncbi:hypothetical protein [Paraglaciecola sp.]|uniref:hypothetical protein n=1 Tax=Paraglaciecola sp. TaxID=1920173 RepID=UPI003EF5FFAE